MRPGRRGSAGARPTVLLTNGEERSVLAAARALAAASYRVACTAGSRQAAALWSRACHEQLVLSADPATGVAAFVSRLEAVLSAGSYELMIPGTDAALLVVSESRSRLEPLTRLGLPSREAVQAALDKRALLQSADALGLETPDSLVCLTRDEVLAAGDEFGLPVMVKARSSVTLEDDRVVQHRSIIAADKQHLSAATREARLPCIVQRLESEPRLLSLAGVATDDGLRAVAASRYLRTWPVRAGAAAFSETVAPRPDVVDAAGAVLERLGWRGIFELEFLERHNGDALLIDLNPRVYGSLALAVAAGANLPAIWCDFLLRERPSGPRVTARSGVRYRWEDADARNLLHDLREGRLRAAIAVARPRRNVSHAFGRLNDPGPLAAHALTLVTRRLRQWRRRTVVAHPSGAKTTARR